MTFKSNSQTLTTIRIHSVQTVASIAAAAGSILAVHLRAIFPENDDVGVLELVIASPEDVVLELLVESDSATT